MTLLQLPAMRLDEQHFWSEMCQGNTAAFEKLYSYFATDLFRYGYRISTDHDLVQDSIQDLFLNLWNKRTVLKEVDSPRFYLYRSLRNKLIRSFESNRFVFSNDGELSDQQMPYVADIESCWISDEDHRVQLEKLHCALKKLPIRQQEAIQLRYYHDFSAEQIAQIMNINQQSVRNLQNRAMQQLRSELPFFPVSLLSVAILIP
ncbi:RNA polymerase sigma factor [Dyadobacter psychrotolerans]|uniref:Sigma-70 family RNA polymerase sigma factor n=1 Tax=Dyadobacter psychrotolerans TaxID=2541721 RepID=A0A4R5DYG4_9BACT|nr:sigma-70 family RNA polymerase sigma factor [Dyadobacter psychrotolerans]TDE17231.1 sigma-70 family RNA polymerase sigma factor [Dyadobacter psychrotolerans]